MAKIDYQQYEAKVTEYQDNKKMSAREAIDTLKSNSLFQGQGVECYEDRMVNAVNSLINNDQWKISMDTDGDGVCEDVNLADAIAASFDSELDLYIQEQVDQVLKKYGSCSKSYLGEQALRELALKGIRVDAVGSSDSMTNRAYSFSLIDVDDEIKKLMQKENLSDAEKQKIYDAVYSDDGKVMQDQNGKKGSYIFADCLIPDGYAQGAEVHLSSILDQMGYDCISRSDFIGNEQEYYDVLKAVENNIYNGVYDSDDAGVSDIYGNTKNISQSVSNLWGGSGSAPGTGGFSTSSTEEARKSAEEQEKLEKQKQEDKEKLLEEKIKEFKAEHDGKSPSRAEKRQLEKEVELELETKYSYKQK